MKQTVITGDISPLSDNLLESMEKFRKFIGAELLEFRDHGNSETLIIHKNGQKFQINACGNKVDGGFFGYSQNDLP